MLDERVAASNAAASATTRARIGHAPTAHDAAAAEGDVAADSQEKQWSKASTPKKVRVNRRNASEAVPIGASGDTDAAETDQDEESSINGDQLMPLGSRTTLHKPLAVI